MLTVILAGGKGTRILEETRSKPKALVAIGGKPIIEHIMGCYIEHGMCEFLILTGYKGYQIRNYFEAKKNAEILEQKDGFISIKFPNSKVMILDTGAESGSAERLRQAESYIKEKCFMLTYCDGLCSVNLKRLFDFHKEQHGMVTLTAVRPEQRFGILEITKAGKVTSFKEKNRKDSPVINGGFMVMETEIFRFMTPEMESLEKDVLAPLAQKGEVSGYYHDGFWQCMDTLQEKRYLNDLWNKGNAPWVKQKKDK